MFKRTKYQQGCLAREKRHIGPDVWIFRWRELNPYGKRVNRKVVVGNVKEYPNRLAASKAADALRLDINKEVSQTIPCSLTLEQLTLHYVSKELREGRSQKAYSTREAYKNYLRKWIVPRWGSYLLPDVKTVAVEEWLDDLSLAPGSKSKVRNIMSVLFNHAIRYEWLLRNPITLVRQSAKRQRIPVVLTVDEIRSLLSVLKHPYRTMVFLAAATGLRASELLALKWGDVDFENLDINLNRSIVHQVVGEMKTEASRKPVPLDVDLADDLSVWKHASPYNQPSDWVFASPETRGRQPYWPENLLRRYVRPAAAACGIEKLIGWHTFRHSYATLLKANGEDVKVVQESLRHANSRITMDTYVQANTAAKRQAQSKVVKMILPERLEISQAVGRG